MVSPLNGCSALLSLASFGALWGSLATRDRQLPGTTFYALRPCGVKPRLLLTTSAPHNYSHHSRLSKPSDSRAGVGNIRWPEPSVVARHKVASHGGTRELISIAARGPCWVLPECRATSTFAGLAYPVAKQESKDGTPLGETLRSRGAASCTSSYICLDLPPQRIHLFRLCKRRPE
ncbi:hypothetical protein FA13DRAFT_1719304 [Coprinellus micaceus]|uniref:Secreted protein n=1 Tax=Coprinellus micaceus TaxID=71717 RepID=A0A4Y7SB99_COPMI|nr:hypothetical protein FA13DRAFT_1719304 [Coprinellus micaceus]